MDKAEKTFNKYAFFATTPFDVKNKKELEDVKGYAKEYGNRLVGSFLGTAAGAAGGGLIGAAAGPEAALAGATIGGIAGAVTGDVRSLRQTEREAGVKPTGVGAYLGRSLGGAVTGAVLPVPILGNAIGDYLTSRKLIGYKNPVELPTNG